MPDQPNVAEINVSNDDEESFTTGTVLVVLRLRIDGRVAHHDSATVEKLYDRLFEALQPFAGITRPDA
jgi:hypothetical protein